MSFEAGFKVLVVEDDPLIAEDLRILLCDNGYSVVVAHAKDEAVMHLTANKPDLVLLDINLGGGSTGVDIARWINANHPIPFIYLTSYADQTTLQQAKDTHPSAYLLKPFTGPDIKVSIEIALSNFYYSSATSPGLFDISILNSYLDSPLSEREIEILNGLNQGLSNKGLADNLFISENTVKSHLKSIFEKLNVKSRTEAIVRIRQLPLD